MNVQLFLKNTELPLNHIKEIKLKRIETNYRINAFAPSREMTLNLNQAILVTRIYPYQSEQCIYFSICSSLFFTEEQILDAALVITILCRTKAKQRVKIIHKLNQSPIIWNDFISQKEIANFKYNQEINKKFNSVQ